MAGVMIIVMLLELLFVVATTIGGVMLIRSGLGRGPGHPACGGCGYDLSGTVGTETRCPECGTDILTAGIIPSKGRRSRWRIAIGTTLLLVPLVGILSCFSGLLLPAIIKAKSTAQTVMAEQERQAARTEVLEGQAIELSPDPGNPEPPSNGDRE